MSSFSNKIKINQLRPYLDFIMNKKDGTAYFFEDSSGKYKILFYQALEFVIPSTFVSITKENSNRDPFYCEVSKNNTIDWKFNHKTLPLAVKNYIDKLLKLIIFS